MTEFLSYLIELFKNFTPLSQVFLVLIAGGLIFLGYSFVTNEAFRSALLNLSKAIYRSLRHHKITLLNHELFYRQNFYLQLINNIKFESEFKTELFKVILEEKSKSVINLTKDWIKSIKPNDITDCQLFDSMTQLVLQIILDYEKTIKEKYKKFENYEAIYKMVYESKFGFKTFHSDNVNYIQKNINKLVYSKAYSKKQKIHSFLTQLEIATEMAVTDCEIAFNSFNGKLEILKNK